MALLEQTAAQEDLRMDYDLQPGDMQFINNHTILHAHSAFEDWQDEKDGGKRHLLRTWISPPNGTSVRPHCMRVLHIRLWPTSLLASRQAIALSRLECEHLQVAGLPVCSCCACHLQQPTLIESCQARCWQLYLQVWKDKQVHFTACLRSLTAAGVGYTIFPIRLGWAVSSKHPLGNVCSKPVVCRPLPDVFAEQWASMEPGNRGGIRVPGVTPHISLAADK